MLLYETEHIDWDIILEEMSNKDHPLRELELQWTVNDDRSVELGFIELTKTIGAHTTLIKLDCEIDSNSSDTKKAVLLEALKDNRSIKYLRLRCEELNSNTAHAFAQTLMNNQTLFALDKSILRNHRYRNT